MITPTSAVPRGTFGRRSTAEQVTAGIDLSGKVALVTGCSSGIGFETMRVLALRGAHVLAVARTQTKAAAAWAKARSPEIKGTITPLGCEHEDFAAVAGCADVVKAMNLPLDIVICNAGIFGGEYKLINGVERQFAVNHLSHFILVNRLLGQVKAAPQGRVVIVSSDAHRSAPKGGIEFDNLSGARGYSAMKAYAHSKLANQLFSRELARRLSGTKATVNALHPGFVSTNIFHTLPGWMRALFPILARPFAKSLGAGAATQCYVATSAALATVNGAYFKDCNPIAPTPVAENDALAAKLWTVSEELTRAYL